MPFHHADCELVVPAMLVRGLVTILVSIISLLGSFVGVVATSGSQPGPVA